MKNLILAAAISFLSLNAMAGGDLEGNGGDVVVCRADHINREFTMLDIIEARNNGLNISLGDPNLPVEKKIDLALERLRQQLPYFAGRIQHLASNFYQEAAFLDDVEMTDIPDSQHVALPRGCHLQQIAIFEDLGIPYRKVYTIDNDIWKELDNDNKTILILHEIIYRLSGAENSIRSRYINALVFSDFFDKEFTSRQLWDILFPAKFERMFANPLWPSQLPIYAGMGCHILKNQSLEQCGVFPSSPRNFDSNGAVKIQPFQLSFENDVNLKVFEYDGTTIYIKVSKKNNTLATMDVQFHLNKNVKKLNFLHPDGHYCIQEGGSETCNVNVIEFNEAGKIVSTCSVKPGTTCE